ncbi:hypothetical protein D3C81_1481560 [compost metagenome]
MGTGNGQHPAALQHMVGQPLRAGNVGQALVQHVLDRRVAARQRVADHHQVRRRFQVRGIVALHQLDALGFELGAHGRVDVGVGTGHPVAEFLGQHGEGTHEGAADAENVDVHADSCRNAWNGRQISTAPPAGGGAGGIRRRRLARVPRGARRAPYGVARCISLCQPSGGF